MNLGIANFGRDQVRVLGKFLRRAREERNCSLKRLAAESGVGVATIRKIESGTANPSLLTVVAMTEALGVSIDQAVAASRVAHPINDLVHGCTMADGDGRSAMSDLTQDLLDPRLSVRLLAVPPGAALARTAQPDSAPLFAYVVGGTLRLAFADDTIEDLRIGDAIHLKDELPMAWSNPAAQHALVLCVSDRRASAVGPAHA